MSRDQDLQNQNFQALTMTIVFRVTNISKPKSLLKSPKSGKKLRKKFSTAETSF